jgi:hypothetical protein
VFFVLLAGVFLEAVALFYMLGAGTFFVLGERREDHSSD